MEEGRNVMKTWDRQRERMWSCTFPTSFPFFFYQRHPDMSQLFFCTLFVVLITYWAQFVQIVEMLTDWSCWLDLERWDFLVQWLCYIPKTVFHSTHPYLLALIFFPFLFCGAHLQARDDINIPFMTDHSIDAYSILISDESISCWPLETEASTVMSEGSTNLWV